MKLDLHEANQKLQEGTSPKAPGTEEVQMRRQIEDQLKTVEQKTRHLEQRNKALDDKEKTLAELDTRLRKKKEHLDQLEGQLSKVIFFQLDLENFARVILFFICYIFKIFWGVKLMK